MKQPSQIGGTVELTDDVQRVREQSFERVMNDAKKAKERLINSVLRDRYMPEDCIRKVASMGQRRK